MNIYDQQAYDYTVNFIKEHPEHKQKANELYVFFGDEADEGSPQQEYENLVQSLKDLLEDEY
jgi:hypothetical protein